MCAEQLVRGRCQLVRRSRKHYRAVVQFLVERLRVVLPQSGLVHGIALHGCPCWREPPLRRSRKTRSNLANFAQVSWSKQEIGSLELCGNSAKLASPSSKSYMRVFRKLQQVLFRTVEDPTKTIEQVGRQIAHLRAEAGLTQAEVAEKLEMTLTNYQRLEHGLQNATIKTLVRIADALGVQARDFWQPPPKTRPGRGRPEKK